MKSKNLILVLFVLSISCTAWSAQDTNPRVLLNTSKGEIVIELLPVAAPITVANFLQYVNDDFYTGLIFHRVIDDFMIQGGLGDPNALRPPIVGEHDNGLRNLRGSIAMAILTGQPDSGTDQFFINQVHNPHLDGVHTVFGQVVDGIEVVDTIASVDVNSIDRPVNDVNIYSITELNCPGEILGDFDENCRIDFDDFLVLASDWLDGQTKSISNKGLALNTSLNNHALSGDIFVWRDNRNGNNDIYAYNLSDSTETAVCIDSSDQSEPEVSGNIVVWRDNRNGNHDIFAYDLSSDNEFVVSSNPLPEREPDISGNIVVWRDYRHYSISGTDIYAADINDPNNPQVFVVVEENEGQFDPAIDGNFVVWDDFRAGNEDIAAADINDPNNPIFFLVAIDDAKQAHPAIDGNTVIFEDHRYRTTIFGMNLIAGKQFLIADGNVDNFDVNGGIVVWQDERNGNWDIYGYNIAAETEFVVTIADGNQIEPVISGSTVAWIDNDDLYWRELCDNYLEGDINGDCEIDNYDLAIMIERWLN